MHYIYTEDLFPPGQALAYLRMLPRAVFMLKWVGRKGYFPHISTRFTIFDLVNEGIFDVMPRQKRSPNAPVQQQNRAVSTGGNTDTTWINCPLSEDDLVTLEQSDATLETIGALLLGIASRGYSFSVKRMDDQVSFMCAIFTDGSDGSGGKFGISAFAGNPADATLACVFKFEEKLGGVFTGHAANAATPRARFR